MTMDILQLVVAMREAIQAEREAVQKALGSLSGVGKLRISGGRRLHADPGAQTYRLNCDAEFLIPEGMRVQLHVPGQVGSGETLRHDVHRDQVECVFREDLGDELPAGTLEFDSTFLLALLEQRLVTIAGGPSETPAAAPVEPFNRELGLAFLTGDAHALPPLDMNFPGLAESQQAAIRFALPQRIAYLWGPPGTGKTQTVAHLVHALLDRKEWVLLSAHTNIATDNALLRVLETRRLPRDSVIRVGYHATGLDKYEVSLESAVDRRLHQLHPDLAEEIVAICRAVVDFHPKHSRALESSRTPLSRRFRIAEGIVNDHGCGTDTDLSALIAAAGKQIESLELSILGHAHLVATTLTRCYSSKLFREFRTDAVVVDEASTASLALSFVVACSARGRAIAVGDFKQLPTIVQATHPAALKWLGRHVFETSGADDVAVDHPLRTMLHEQWRMHPDISGVVSRVFYGGRLTNAPAVLQRTDPGPAVALLDTTSLSPLSEQTPAGSKINRAHARLIAELLAAPGMSDRSIAVITPYRAQVRLIRETVRARRPELLATERLEIFTVHRFQGRDKDIVLFDLTEAPGTRTTFLDDLKTPHAPNLINVAMSRARLRLVVIGAFDHLRTSLGEASSVLRVLKVARVSGALQVDAGHLADRGKIDTLLGIGGVE